MRIISDFDGVFTSQEGEAAAVGDHQLHLITQALGDAERALSLVGEMRARVRAHGERYGWLSGGELACYADEDPYVFHNAVAAALWLEGPADFPGVMAAAGHTDHSSFAQRCFGEGTELYRRSHRSHLVSEAGEVLRALSGSGVEVVVVSNSSGDRIQRIFDDFGAEVFVGITPRVRGDARKFSLSPELAELPTSMELGGRTVRLRRGNYHAILTQELPRLVIGDVLSLDLALPLWLRDNDPRFTGLTLCIKQAAHTPSWVLEVCRERGIHVLTHLSELLPIVAAL